jgi:hypothetical protein
MTQLKIFETIEEAKEELTAAIKETISTHPILKRFRNYQIEIAIDDVLNELNLAYYNVDFIFLSKVKNDQTFEITLKMISTIIKNWDADGYTIKVKNVFNVTKSIEKEVMNQGDSAKGYFIQNRYLLVYDGNEDRFTFNTNEFQLAELMENLVLLDYEGKIRFIQEEEMSKETFDLLKRDYKIKKLLKPFTEEIGFANGNILSNELVQEAETRLV